MWFVMMSWGENTFCTTCPMCRESTGQWWIPHTKEHQCGAFMYPSLLSWASSWTNTPLLVIWGAIRFMWRHSNEVTSPEEVSGTAFIFYVTLVHSQVFHKSHQSHFSVHNNQCVPKYTPCLPFKCEAHIYMQVGALLLTYINFNPSMDK